MTGRHRRGAGTWTPQVPPRAAGGRHASFTPADPPARGSLPPLSPLETTSAAFPAAHGELPLPEPVTPPRRPPRRTKVTLTPPTPHDENAEDDDVRVYVAPPETGLGSFDLGSVPASVTPPRTWRKAAWFATASSGGVVLALLFAGSALVGKPTPDQAGDAWIPGLGGGLPTLGGERVVPAPDGGGYSSEPSNGRPAGESSTSSSAETTAPLPESIREPDGTTSEGSVNSPVTPTRTTSGTPAGQEPTTTPVPVKPAPTSAPYDADPFRFRIPQGDPKVLAQNSQRYLDTVTEDPQAAYAMTTGELQQEGAEGLEQKYADVAYFQVQHVQVHQYDGTTVCTVKLVRKNGTADTVQRTLTFEGGKIASDGS
ncbi:hypothetical protein FHX82_000956 [Amycolatopsis bartoniae]|uniref:hypothetical protein n=1 Tax=Amycolatopsis bartoniae TaxID=941986 RepID=UPI00182B37B3|nr:hypothetical protein [Amycolatopsis bartoniae]MBB2933936.1 hypothetical protein [Amycolatopsis bartoniae]